MSQTTICRICLARNVKMHSVNNTHLQEVYEKLTNIKMNEHCKPYFLCYICISQMKRCQMLMKMATESLNLFNNIVSSGVEMSQVPTDVYQDKTFNLSMSQVFNIIQIDPNTENIYNNIKIEEETCKQTKIEENDDIIESYMDALPMLSSDSEDDLPLKSIRSQLSKNKLNIKVKNKKKDVIKVDAYEIILTKEEQLKDITDRAKSLNYQTSPLKCDLCFKGFVDTNAYKNHKKKHDEANGEYECEICHMRYATSRQLKIHGNASHAKKYVCNKCNHHSHTANQAREHELWHSGWVYTCALCSRQFRKHSSYLTHRRVGAGCGPRTVRMCGGCGRGYLGERGLAAHRCVNQKTNSTEESNPDLFCKDCDIQFLNSEAWKRHLLTSVKHTTDSKTSTQCAICSETFPSSGQLACHTRAHRKALSGDRAPLPAQGSTRCRQCGLSFVNRYKLQAHVKRMHLGLKYNKNIVCEVCGKKCTSNATLVYHQRTHTGERPHSCPACPKRFTDRNQLRIHSRTHSGERPYACEHCPKRFTQKPALNRHYRVHTGAKPYECQYCSKTFSQSNSMKLHVKTVHLKIPPNRKKTTTKNDIDN